MKLSRRQIFKAAFAGAGAAVGARLGGGLLGTAHAAGEPAHVVHIMFPGGYNALFGGVADKFVTGNTFGVTSTNIKDLGGGVFTDAGTLGTLSPFALSHWAAVGIRHGSTSHLANGAEKAILYDGTNSYLNQLAVAMGGTSALKSVHFGDRMPYGPQPAFQGVSLQRVTDLANAIRTLGAGTPDPSAPDRELVAKALAASQAVSGPHISAHPKTLGPSKEAYEAAAAAAATPAPKPVTFNEISTAYGLAGATEIKSFASMLAGAEVMIRAGGTNVVNICDPGFVLWDFHQVTSGGASRNGEFSRNKFTRSIMTPLKAFVDRMLNLPDRNVVVVLNGDFVRLPSGDHGDGTMVTVLGKYVKNTVTFPCDGRAKFAQGTPTGKTLWAAIAQAARVPGTPFGANPHAITV